MPLVTDNEIRAYLLGTLSPASREQIEDSLLVSDEGLAQLELVEEELLDDYLTGQLGATELPAFERNFLTTQARQSKLEYLRAIRDIAARTETQTTMQSVPNNVIPFRAKAPNAPRSFTRATWLRLAAALLLVGTAALFAWRLWPRTSNNESLIALNRAYATGRPFEPRIGGFDYAPYAPTRGASDPETEARILRERAERILLDNIAEKNSAANQHALGKYYLADKRFDQAIEQFNAALKDLPNFAELHNDLGVALLEKAKFEKRNNQPGDSLQHLAASLESITQALKLQPDYPAAVFNKALCLQEMYLPRQAIEEWKKYLQLDPNSPWAADARRRLEELEKAPSNITVNDDELYKQYLASYAASDVERAYDLFCQGYSTTGNAITERLIDDHLAARNQGDTATAANKLNLLEQLGTLVYLRATDPYVRDVARFYQQLPVRQLATVSQARVHLNEGRQLRTTKQLEAVKQYQAASSSFQQIGDESEAKMTTYLLGRLHLRQLNLSKSQKLFQGLSSSANPYLWLRGMSLNGMADFYGLQSLPDEAIHANQSALMVSIQLGNINQQVTNASSLAWRYSELGNWEQGLNSQTQALGLVSRKPASHQQHWATYIETARQLFIAGFNTTALAYQQEALNIELATKRHVQLSRTYTDLATMFGREERFTEAIPLVQEAVDIGVRQGTEKVGLEIQAYSGLYLADLQRKARDFGAALQSYERIINLNKQLGVEKYDFEVYRGKALTEIALGYTEQAKHDLAQALAIFERNRNHIFAEKERTIYVDKEYEIYDTAIDYAIAENPQAAFDLSEKGRARSLLEVIKGRRFVKANNVDKILSVAERQQPLSLRAVQQQIPPNTSLLEFTCLPDRLLVFVISGNSFTYSQNFISLPLLEKKVRAFLLAVSETSSTDNHQTKALAAELYQILIGPLDPLWAEAQTICIVPDKVLHYLPFAALFSVQHQKYLIESHALVTAPSASVFLLCLERARYRKLVTNERVLAIGNPRFDPAVYPQLPDLMAATREANNIASNYSRHHILTAEQATEEKVKAQFKRSTIIHLAAHGIIDERSWANSWLVLAKTKANNEEDGSLRAYEITQMQLPVTRLAVLSACQSGIDRFYRGEGMTGLGRAFLAAGVPTVVASLWRVDSDASATLMIEFYRQLKSNSASQALRQAQLALMHNANAQYQHPRYWAAFSTFGSDSFL